MTDSSASDIQIPGYTLKRELGRGGMATVYLAEQDSLGREVALKVMTPELGANPTFAARFQSEARTIAQLSHPNIIPIYDVGRTNDGVYYLTMQYLPGGDLQSRVGERFSDEETALVMGGICQALSVAHDRGFVHRDVKPANILFDASDTPVLTDFGIARALASEARLTGVDMRVGTACYMSPEQAQGGKITAGTDIYSAGVVLYELLTGKPVFEAETELAMAYQHVNEAVPRLPEDLGHWQAVVDTALAKDPAKRYAQARDLYDAICQVIGITPAGFTGIRFRPAVKSATDPKSIAVLPFANLSRDEANEPFTAGIHDDLLTLISKIGSIKTISRTSVMHYRDTTRTIPEIARELGVSTVLQGGIQRAGDQVRVNVQLIDAASDEHLWADTYDRELTAANVFAIQTEIATAIAQALQAKLSPAKQERLETVPTENMAAYEAYLMGRQRLAKRSTAALTEAVEYFQKAVKLDPEFALAWMGLADGILLQEDFAGRALEASFVRAETAIKTALKLDDRLSEAYASLGRIKTFRMDPKGAESAFRRALELDPNAATAHLWYGILIALSGRTEESLPLFKRAVELDPLSAINNNLLADVFRAQGRFAEALAMYDKINKIDPEFPLAYLGPARIFWFAFGKLDEAVPWYLKAHSIDAGNPGISAELGALYLDLGDVGRAEEWINKAMAMAPENYGANWAHEALLLYRDGTSGESRLDSLPVGLANWDPISLRRRADVRAERYDEAQAWYEQTYPRLQDPDAPKIDRPNFRPAIDLAFVLQNMGAGERAERLLDGASAFIETIPRLGFWGYGIADAQMHALRGDAAAALGAVRQAIDAGWRGYWWYYADHDLKLASLREDPEFKAMMDEIRTDMAAQLARVQASKNESSVGSADAPS